MLNSRRGFRHLSIIAPTTASPSLSWLNRFFYLFIFILLHNQRHRGKTRVTIPTGENQISSSTRRKGVEGRRRKKTVGQKITDDTQIDKGRQGGVETEFAEKLPISRWGGLCLSAPRYWIQINRLFFLLLRVAIQKLIIQSQRLYITDIVYLYILVQYIQKSAMCKEWMAREFAGWFEIHADMAFTSGLLSISRFYSAETQGNRRRRRIESRHTSVALECKRTIAVPSYRSIFPQLYTFLYF